MSFLSIYTRQWNRPRSLLQQQGEKNTKYWSTKILKWSRKLSMVGAGVSVRVLCWAKRKGRCVTRYGLMNSSYTCYIAYYAYHVAFCTVFVPNYMGTYSFSSVTCFRHSGLGGVRCVKLARLTAPLDDALSTTRKGVIAVHNTRP